MVVGEGSVKSLPGRIEITYLSITYNLQNIKNNINTINGPRISQPGREIYRRLYMVFHQNIKYFAYYS